MKTKGKLKFVTVLTMLFSFFWCVSTSAVNALEQKLSIDPSTITKAVNESLIFGVKYSIENDALASSITARIFYNPSKLTFVEFTNVDTNKLDATDSIPVNDTSDEDSDPLTTKWVGLTYFDLKDEFPGAPRKLFDATFTVNSNSYNGLTKVNVFSPTLDIGNTLVSENLSLTITGGKDAPATPVLSPATGFKKEAVNVTATVDPAPIKSYYTTDGSVPTKDSTEYTGAAFVVNGADKAKVTVKMISHDAGEGIYGSVGSAVYTFDKADPTGAITAPGADAFVKSTSLNITGTAADTGGSGIDKVEVSINGGAWKAATGTATWTYAATLTKGANAIRARITDKVGNILVITGNTITYYPPLALSIDGVDVTGKTVNIPNTAGSNTKTVTVTGGSEAYATYTWLPAAQANVGALTAGASPDKKVYTAEVGKKGTHKITVTDPADVALFTTDITFNVVDFSVTGPFVAYLGTALEFTAAGNTGDVTWTVKSGADVAGTPVISGTKKEKAKVTPLKPGTFILSAKDGGTGVTFEVPLVRIWSDYSQLPTETVKVNPGASSSAFTVSGLDGNAYTWTVSGPSKISGGTGTSYMFPAPSTGNFAGEYTVTVTETGGESKSFKVYVPLKIEPAIDPIATLHFSLLANGAPQGFIVTGAAESTGYTTTIDSLSDGAADVVATGSFDSKNSASFEFDPKIYGVTPATGAKNYTLDFEAKGHEGDIPQIIIEVVPIKTFAGVIVDNDGGALSDALVTITSTRHKGMTQTSDAAGAFAFADIAMISHDFKVEKAGYVTTTFKSGVLSDDGKFEIKLQLQPPDPDPPVVDPPVVTGKKPAGGGRLDASLGGEIDVTEDPGLEEALKGKFGSNTIKLIIKPQADKKTIAIALPEPAVYEVTPATPQSAIQWEIVGLGSDGCAEVPVPFPVSDAAGLQAGSLVVLYANAGDPNNWKVAEIVGEPDYIGDGQTGLLYAKVCGWSVNLVGIGANPASPVIPATPAGSGGSGGCFINSVSAAGTSGSMVAWLAIAGILMAGVVLRMSRRSKSL